MTRLLSKHAGCNYLHTWVNVLAHRNHKCFGRGSEWPLHGPNRYQLATPGFVRLLNERCVFHLYIVWIARTLWPFTLHQKQNIHLWASSFNGFLQHDGITTRWFCSSGFMWVVYILRDPGVQSSLVWIGVSTKYRHFNASLLACKQFLAFSFHLIPTAFCLLYLSTFSKKMRSRWRQQGLIYWILVRPPVKYHP